MKKRIIFALLAAVSSTQAYDLNNIDSEGLNKLFQMNNPKVQSKLLQNANTAWSAIRDYNPSRSITIPLFDPIKGFVISDSLGLRGNKTGLTTFDLSGYGISDVTSSFILPDPFQLFGGDVIDLSNTNLTASDGVGKTRTIQTIKMNNNKLSRLSDDIGLVGASLERFEVKNNEINVPFSVASNSSSNVVFSLVNLNYLDLSNNRMGGSVPDTFFYLRNVAYIDISCNGMSGSLFSSNATTAAKVAGAFKGKTFIATAKTCLPGKRPNNFSNEATMKNLGIEFGQKVHIPTGGVTDVEPKCDTKTNAKLFYNQPSSNLCLSGKASSVSATTTGWTWQCQGEGGFANSPVSCLATKVTPAKCATQPTNGFTLSDIKSGTLSKFCDSNARSKSKVSLSADFTSWTWSCYGQESADFPNGKQAQCTAPVQEIQQCTIGKPRQNVILSSLDLANLTDEKKNNIFCEIGKVENISVSGNKLTWDCKGTDQSKSGTAEINLCNQSVVQKQYERDAQLDSTEKLCSVNMVNVLKELGQSFALSADLPNVSSKLIGNGPGRVYSWSCDANRNQEVISSQCQTRFWFLADSFENN